MSVGERGVSRGEGVSVGERGVSRGEGCQCSGRAGGGGK